MTDFKFKVGDKVRLAYWNRDEWIEILYMGKSNFFAKTQGEHESTWNKEWDWQLYELAQESLIGRTFEFETTYTRKSYPTIKFIKEVK